MTEVLLMAPWGSERLLDAVLETMAMFTDEEFAALMCERERIHGRDLPPLLDPKPKRRVTQYQSREPRKFTLPTAAAEDGFENFIGRWVRELHRCCKRPLGE